MLRVVRPSGLVVVVLVSLFVCFKHILLWCPPAYYYTVKRAATAAVRTESTRPASPSDSSSSLSYRVWPILLRAGANLPADPNQFRAYKARQYIQKVIDAGGWATYERHHLDKLTAMLTPKDDGRRRSPRRRSPLRRVPPEVLRNIAAFAFHAGNPRTRNGWATEQY